MHEYEIRVLNNRLSTSLIMKTVQPSDGSAINTGRKIADGQPFEVWRELQCVYGSQAGQLIPFPARPPAA